MANPFVLGNSTKTAQEELVLYKEYAWDFIHDCFKYDENHNHIIVTENEAMKVWIYKTLKTERWKYLAYENCYGIELEQFIGKRTNNTVAADEIKQYIKEALLINPYIIKINSIEATIEEDKLSYLIDLTTVYGNMVVSSEGDY